MKRTMVSLAVLTSGLLGFSTEPASAQLSVGVHLSWHWSEGGWHSDRVLPRGDMYRAPAPLPGYGAPARSVRIPPGHLPPPGTCRLWYVGRPPGHQPPPTSCARLFRGYGQQSGVIVLQGAPAHRLEDGWYRYDPRWEREFRYDRYGRYGDDDRYRERRPGKAGKGKPGRGRGRGG